MTTKKKSTPPAKQNANTLNVTLDKGKSKERKMAELGLSASTLNTVTALNFAKENMGEIDLTESISVMREKIDQVKAGDITGLEATLTA